MSVSSVTVWKNWANPDLETAWINAEVNGRKLSEIFDEQPQVEEGSVPVTPTELYNTVNMMNSIPEANAVNGLKVVQLCDMTSVKSLNPMSVTVSDINVDSDLVGNHNAASEALNRFFQQVGVTDFTLPENARYCFPPLVSLYHPSEKVIEDGQLKSMTTDVVIRYVENETPVKGWAFVIPTAV